MNSTVAGVEKHFSRRIRQLSTERTKIFFEEKEKREEQMERCESLHGCFWSIISFVDRREIGLNEWWTRNIGQNLNIEEWALTSAY